MLPTITIKFEPRDLWIGVYWKHRRSIESPAQWLTLYVCIVPMLPIILEWAWGWKIKDEAYENYCRAAWIQGRTAIGYQEWKRKQP